MTLYWCGWSGKTLVPKDAVIRLAIRTNAGIIWHYTGVASVLFLHLWFDSWFGTSAHLILTLAWSLTLPLLPDSALLPPSCSWLLLAWLHFKLLHLQASDMIPLLCSLHYWLLFYPEYLLAIIFYGNLCHSVPLYTLPSSTQVCDSKIGTRWPCTGVDSNQVIHWY